MSARTADLSVAYGIPLRCACDALVVRGLLDALHAARWIRGLCVAVVQSGSGLVANVIVQEPTVAVRALLDVVIAGSPLRPLTFSTLWTSGGLTAGALAARLSCDVEATEVALDGLARLGLVARPAGPALPWRARMWAAGGEG
jgi:hypothetical protein